MQAHSHHVSPEEGTTPDPSVHLPSPASTSPASNRRAHLSFQEMLRQQLGQQVCLIPHFLSLDHNTGLETTAAGSSLGSFAATEGR